MTVHLPGTKRRENHGRRTSKPGTKTGNTKSTHKAEERRLLPFRPHNNNEIDCPLAMSIQSRTKTSAAVVSHAPRSRLHHESSTSPPPPQYHYPQHPPQHTHTSSLDDTIVVRPRINALAALVHRDADAADGHPPPAKRRKVQITIKPDSKQTTLDAFNWNRSLPVTNDITLRRQNPDDLEDELSRPSPTPERVPRRATRSPAPAQSTPQPTHGQQELKKKAEEKRTLRSQDDGPRLKSELAVYFPNFEQVIFDLPTGTDDFLTVDSALYITDDVKKEEVSPAKLSKASRRISVNGNAGPPATPQRSGSNQFNGSPSLNLDFASKTLPENPKDPLTDEHFLKSHRRAERKEKQLRNIERERAMHEKVQLERLLEGLKGHDWLKVLGITGVTETEAKKFEPKRDFFISEVKALLDKFTQWKDQERKLRLEKEAAQAAKEAEEEMDDTTEGSVEPPSSDLNASAARQLQQETVNALRASAKANSKAKDRHVTSHPATPSTPIPPKPVVPPSPELPITSFYAKRHLRDAALSKTRHGRNLTAFGHALPEMDEAEFYLPEEYVTADTLKSNARERRRRKRESAVNSTT